VIAKTQTIFSIATLLIVFSCRNQDQGPLSFAPKVVAAHGYVVPKDSMATPKIILARNPVIVRAGKPKIVMINTNVHPAGIPRVVEAGTPKVCTPGQDSFSLPEIVPAIDSPFLAGIPEEVTAKEADVKEQNTYNFMSFGKLQGLKSDIIECGLEDKNGNLWFKVRGVGVSKYDGKSFTHITEKEGLSKGNVMSMLEDKSGALWFGTQIGGVSKYDGKNFTHFTQKEGLTNSWVLDMAQDKSGNFWFGTGSGLYKYDGKSFTHFTVKEGLSSNFITDMLEDQNGDLWFGTDEAGVTKYDGKSFTHFTKKEGLSSNHINDILQDKSGNLWFGTGEGGVSKYDGKSFTHFTKREGLIENSVFNIAQDNKGNLWMATDYGLSKYDGQSFTNFTLKQGLSDSSVNSVLEDKNGNLWLGTHHRGGANRYGGQMFTHFGIKEGLSDNGVRSTLKDKRGNLWFGTWAGGVIKYDERSFTIFNNMEGLVNGSIESMLEDKNGNLWFGSWDGISKYDGKSFTYFPAQDGLPGSVMTILEDKRGNLWFGTYGGGVSKYDGENFTRFTEQEGLSNNVVMSSLEDKHGNLWFGTYGGGISKYDGKNFTNFTEKGGLGSNNVGSIHEDKSGNLWFGTSRGVSKYDGKNFTHFTEKEGLSNNEVRSILEDKRGDLWFGTANGLSKLEEERLTYLTKVETNMAASALSNPGPLFKTYMYEDGFSGGGVNIGKTMCEANDGTIWIGANDRITAFHPNEEIPDTIAPNIQLTGLALFNEKIPWQNLMSYQDESVNRQKVKDTGFVLGNGVRLHDLHFDSVSKWFGVPGQLSLPYDNNQLKFQFIGITMRSPEKVKYQFKLEGVDKNWSAPTDRNEAEYGNLSHGTYTFKVKAMNGDGYWSRELSYSFTIRPPWWRTWWFTTLVALVLVGGVYRFIQYRSRNLKQRNILLEKKVTERTHELNHSLSELKNTQDQLVHSEKMASLGELTSGIAHEIKNPLNFINNFSEINLELITEIDDERPGKEAENAEIIKTLKKNLEKINHHGKRVDDIVKSMLQHSRMGSLTKEPVNVNVLCEESLKLAYHGFKAKEKTFQSSYETHFDPGLPQIMAIPQELNRVLLNLFNNAFYAVHEKKKKMQPVSTEAPDIESSYRPMVTVSTKRSDSKIVISISDNGTGIPQKIITKIFQPFFTTKPTGEGAGLGLSMSYDIITKSHGGELLVKSKEGEGTNLEIVLPV